MTYLGTVSAAFNALMRLSLRIHAERTDRADALAWYLEDPRRLFIPARLLISTVTILMVALLARATGVDKAGLPVLILSIILVVLACEHLIPLVIVRHDPERVLDVLLPSFDAMARLLKPITVGLLRLGTSTRRRNLSGVRTDHHKMRTPQTAPPVEEPATAAVAASPADAAEAVQEGQARELLRNLADFRETMVREVMTPRPDIVAIEHTATIEQLYRVFREQQYSRIPAYKDTLDNVQGFVHIKDLIQRGPALNMQAPVTPITPFIRPAHFVPETKRVPELLKEFQRRQVQMAIVVDEYGGTAGLVTIEDIVEEIVGEIADEYDVAERPPVERLADGAVRVTARLPVEDLGELFGVELDAGEVETVGGLLAQALGRVPIPGAAAVVGGLRLVAEGTTGRRNRIDTVLVQRVDAEDREYDDVQERQPADA